MKRYEKIWEVCSEHDWERIFKFSEERWAMLSPCAFVGSCCGWQDMASGYMTSGCFCGNKMQQDATRLSRKALKDDGALPTSMRSFAACLQLAACARKCIWNFMVVACGDCLSLFQVVVCHRHVTSLDGLDSHDEWLVMTCDDVALLLVIRQRPRVRPFRSWSAAFGQSSAGSREHRGFERGRSLGRLVPHSSWRCDMLWWYEKRFPWMPVDRCATQSK